KLLEAAAMARPILVTPLAIQGLEFPEQAPPMHVCESPKDWLRAISQLWQNPRAPAALGAAALKWVKAHHSWDTAARQLTPAFFDNQTMPTSTPTTPTTTMPKLTMRDHAA